MKRSDVLRLIKSHCEQNDVDFNGTAASIAQEFEQTGAPELAGYIMSLISHTRTFVPQTFEESYEFLKPLPASNDPLPLPECIANDLVGIINAVGRDMGVNAFLFQGPPGTGKTEASKQLARILNRTLYSVDFNSVIDSRLGETSKNIAALFDEVNLIGANSIVLFDEIDALALDRTNSNDVREMGRATSALLKELDSLNNEVVLIATTNLYDKLDRALVRRFDTTVDFGRYAREDLEEVGSSIMAQYAKKYSFIKSDPRLLKKILHNAPHLPYPGELSNLIKSCVAFSDPNNPTDYLRRLYEALFTNEPISVDGLSRLGFTLREIEALTGTPRNTVARIIKETADE